MYRKISLLWLLTFLLLVFPVSMQAAVRETDASQTVAASKAKKTGWVTKKQKVYYYNDKGKKVKGLQKIGKRYYYFDKNGVQRTGWQIIDGEYYYFRIVNGKKGYMRTSCKVNGVKLRKNGTAKQTKTSLVKLKVLYKANKIVEKITKPTMTKYDKLKTCFQYLKTHYKYRGSPTFHKTKQWECTYAMDMFNKGYGNCYAYGAAFAFLANAAGYNSAYAISSGGHGWAEVKGNVFDPDWELADKRHSYFDMPYSLSGKDGRPNYKKAKLYVKKI